MNIIKLDERNIYTEIFNQTNEAYKYKNIYTTPYEKISNDSKDFINVQKKFHAYLQQSYKYYKNR